MLDMGKQLPFVVFLDEKNSFNKGERWTRRKAQRENLCRPIVRQNDFLAKVKKEYAGFLIFVTLLQFCWCIQAVCILLKN